LGKLIVQAGNPGRQRHLLFARRFLDLGALSVCDGEIATELSVFQTLIDQFFEEIADQRCSDTDYSLIRRSAGSDEDLTRGGYQQEFIQGGNG
jgi:hypothetical protein